MRDIAADLMSEVCFILNHSDRKHPRRSPSGHCSYGVVVSNQPTLTSGFSIPSSDLYIGIGAVQQ